MYKNLLLRWSLGSQNTLTLSSFDETAKYKDYLWLAKLSICSFAKWFPGAQCVLLYNGHDFSRFCDFWNEIALPCQAEIINQRSKVLSGEYTNKYHFFPIGVWWKWIPFRLDISKHEIAIDTDILCIGKPDSWYTWLDGKDSLVVAPERFEEIKVNTCGDLFRHPLLRGKPPANCGILGQRAGQDYSERFFDISKQVRFGRTHDSMFITEQGVVNLWVYSLELDGVSSTILDFKKNAWLRDFVYFMRNGTKVETVHAVSWYKEIVRKMKDVFEARILGQVSDDDFLNEILKNASQFGGLANRVISQQLWPDFGPEEYYLVQVTRETP